QPAAGGPRVGRARQPGRRPAVGSRSGNPAPAPRGGPAIRGDRLRARHRAGHGPQALRPGADPAAERPPRRGPVGVPAVSDLPVKTEDALESLVGQVADEFLRRQRAGERPDVAEYVGRYPEAADLLRTVLASLRWLNFSQPGASPTEAAPADVAGTLGDFRLLREVGRGGMGVVYEAVQISLDRRVALKVLPFAAALDGKHLQRFKNEAQ